MREMATVGPGACWCKGPERCLRDVRWQQGNGGPEVHGPAAVHQSFSRSESGVLTGPCVLRVCHRTQ